MRRRASAVLVVLVGVVFISTAFASGIFRGGPPFEAMTDDFRAIMTDDQITTLRQDVSGLAAVGTEIQEKVVPTLAAALNMTPEQFGAFLGRQFPGVAQGTQAIPGIASGFGRVVDTLDAELHRFARADAIPTSNLPATTVPWAVLAIGILTLVVGFLMLRPGGMKPVAAIVLGAIVLAGLFALSLPQKAADADKMNENLKPVYTAELVAQAQQGLATVGAMGAEFQTGLLPALATQLRMTPAEVQAFLDSNFPATAAALGNLGASLQRFTTVVGIFDDNLANYDKTKDVSLAPVAWTLVGGSIAVSAFGIAALPQRRRAARRVTGVRRAA